MTKNMASFLSEQESHPLDVSKRAPTVTATLKGFCRLISLSQLLGTVLTRGMARVGKCFESKISKPTKLDCKQNFYFTVYYITLNSNCEA